MIHKKESGSAESKDSGGQVIIEEKFTKVNGETDVKRYRRGEFLGKGMIYLMQVVLLDATKPLT